MQIFKTFQLEVAHNLPNVAKGHKCRRLHGHSIKVEVHVGGNVQTETGWVMDFAELSEHFKPIFETLDHSYLNEVEGLENPTSEHLAIWIWERLKPKLPKLVSVVIRETCDSGCIYSPSR